MYLAARSSGGVLGDVISSTERGVSNIFTNEEY